MCGAPASQHQTGASYSAQALSAYMPREGGLSNAVPVAGRQRRCSPVPRRVHSPQDELNMTSVQVCPSLGERGGRRNGGPPRGAGGFFGVLFSGPEAEPRHPLAVRVGHVSRGSRRAGERGHDVGELELGHVPLH